MRQSELLKLLRKQGMKLEREGANHMIYINPANGRTTPIQRSKGEIATGTVQKILKDLGLK
jgi:predicted RNA binding protein YcfA (HicA-like mRNA interferase family)